MSAQRISANAISALKDALTAVFWFKRDLYEYAKGAVGGGRPFWLASTGPAKNQYKRDSVSLFVDRLVREQDDYQHLLLGLLVDVAAMTDFPQLRRVDDPEPKIVAAREAVKRLREVVQPYEQALMEAQGGARAHRRREAHCRRATSDVPATQ